MTSSEPTAPELKPRDVLLVFDLDGTVVDAFRDIQAAVNHALEYHGLPTHDLDTIRGFVGNGLSRLVERALPPDRGDLLEDVKRLTMEHYAAHPADHAEVYAGIPEAIAELRAGGHPTALLSNKPDPLVQQAVLKLGLTDLFDQIAGERDGVPLKPNPAGLLAFQAAAGARLPVMIGDGVPDAEVAQAAGGAFVGVAWGMTPEAALMPFGIVARRPVDLPEAIAETLRRT